jgi:hypothetical protein
MVNHSLTNSVHHDARMGYGRAAAIVQGSFEESSAPSVPCGDCGDRAINDAQYL